MNPGSQAASGPLPAGSAGSVLFLPQWLEATVASLAASARALPTLTLIGNFAEPIWFGTSATDSR